MCKAIERDDLVTDPRLATNEERLAHESELNAAIQAYFSQHDTEEMMCRLVAADVLAAPINTLRDAVADPQVQYNQMVVEVEHARVELKVGGVPVKLTRTPGAICLAAPTLGQHIREVLQEVGVEEAELEQLQQAGVIK